MEETAVPVARALTEKIRRRTSHPVAAVDLGVKVVMVAVGEISNCMDLLRTPNTKAPFTSKALAESQGRQDVEVLEVRAMATV